MCRKDQWLYLQFFFSTCLLAGLYLSVFIEEEFLGFVKEVLGYHRTSGANSVILVCNLISVNGS